MDVLANLPPAVAAQTDTLPHDRMITMTAQQRRTACIASIFFLVSTAIPHNRPVKCELRAILLRPFACAYGRLAAVLPALSTSVD
jgi:hypothetical protein